jgi:hypothetical protein
MLLLDTGANRAEMIGLKLANLDLALYISDSPPLPHLLSRRHPGALLSSEELGLRVERDSGGHPVHSDEWPRLTLEQSVCQEGSHEWESALSGVVQLRASRGSSWGLS